MRVRMNRAIELTAQAAASDSAAGKLLDCSERVLRIFTRRLLWKGERVFGVSVACWARGLLLVSK